MQDMYQNIKTTDVSVSTERETTKRRTNDVINYHEYKPF